MRPCVFCQKPVKCCGFPATCENRVEYAQALEQAWCEAEAAYSQRTDEDKAAGIQAVLLAATSGLTPHRFGDAPSHTTWQDDIELQGFRDQT